MAKTFDGAFRFLPRRWWSRTLCLVLAVLLLPYLVSRFASPWRQIAIRQSTVTVSDSPFQALRITTYNIAHGRGLADDNWQGGSPVERAERLRKIGDLLKEANADIVVLNEVDFDASWSNRVNQAEFLAKHAGYPYHVEQRNLDFRILNYTWRFGNAVLSRYPIAAAEVLPLPSEALWETILAGKKRAIRCQIDAPGGRINLVAVHLAHRSEEVRVASAKQILSTTKDLRDPVFLVGDLNSTPKSFPQWAPGAEGHSALDLLDASKRFQRSPSSTYTPADFTYPSSQGTTIIDWILIPTDWKFESYQVLDSQLSDHRPVVAEILPSPP